MAKLSTSVGGVTAPDFKLGHYTRANIVYEQMQEAVEAFKRLLPLLLESDIEDNSAESYLGADLDYALLWPKEHMDATAIKDAKTIMDALTVAYVIGHGAES